MDQVPHLDQNQDPTGQDQSACGCVSGRSGLIDRPRPTWMHAHLQQHASLSLIDPPTLSIALAVLASPPVPLLTSSYPALSYFCFLGHSYTPPAFISLRSAWCTASTLRLYASFLLPLCCIFAGILGFALFRGTIDPIRLGSGVRFSSRYLHHVVACL